ncbi:N-succinylarginine dihydrolase [Parasphingorhabdus sp. DH2-15]|uniref:N-succinylarginine dihydrolase n=1 Tax=Parasphingorhabdus sp. DH2-15 TaxID=3444112 RepID=UPI003F686D56
MTETEINFDGIIGPSHNYAGLSLGNIASATNAGESSFPRAAALQGIAKMRHNIDLGLAQGFFMPQPRPDHGWLQSLGTTMAEAQPHIQAAAFSASSMWAANAATVSPAADTQDGKCHLTVANLVTMPHRSHEWGFTLKQLQMAFGDTDKFAVHGPVPPPFGDEGAANHMRLCEQHDAPGVEIFVYGTSGGPFPARQHLEASKAVARRHGLSSDNMLLIQQSEQAIAAGAFHNDVVAVANEHVLLVHEQAFAEPLAAYNAIREKCPWVEIVEVPASSVSLADAISSYLFNAQLVTLPDGGGMALILPTEAQDNANVWNWLQAMTAGNGPIRKLLPVNVRQSMANGGGPACLRLRVVADPASIDQRFMANHDILDRLEALVTRYWPEQIAPADISKPETIAQCEMAHEKLLDLLELTGLTEN